MSTLTPPPAPKHHVFVDCENIHPVDAALIGAESFHFTFLLGAQQTKLDVALVEKLMAHAATVQLIRLTSSGRNALDFALAYYLGRAVLTNPTASFHIISKDNGFEPLVEHLRSQQLRVLRHDDFASLAVPGRTKSPSAPSEDLLPRVLGHLRKNAATRPKRKKTLMSHLLAVCGKTATEADVVKLIEALSKDGHLSIGEKETVTYPDQSVPPGAGAPRITGETGLGRVE